MPFLFLNADTVALRLPDPLGVPDPLGAESDEELLRFASRFIQFENGRRFECLSIIVPKLAGSCTNGLRMER